MGQKSIDPSKPLYVLECSEPMHEDSRKRLEQLWSDRFPNQQMIIADGGMTIKLLPASDCLLATDPVVPADLRTGE